MKTVLPTDSADRKNYPVHRGFLQYFPYFVAVVSWISKRGNDKHNPGEPLHHARGKSTDHSDCVVRHLLDIDEIIAKKVILTQEDADKLKEELGQFGWRAAAFVQETAEKYLGAPLAPSAVEVKSAPQQTNRCHSYWGKHEHRCILVNGHDGQHLYAGNPP